eukprot:5013967-Prymnesium_polylepis.1
MRTAAAAVLPVVVASQSAVECAACNKLFHACCVGVSDPEVAKTWLCLGSVSYTHLTLPTICSV